MAARYRRIQAVVVIELRWWGKVHATGQCEPHRLTGTPRGASPCLVGPDVVRADPGNELNGRERRRWESLGGESAAGRNSAS